MDDDYLEAVLDLVERIPPGRAMTYGTIAEVVGDLFVDAGAARRGGPRQVGHVLARAGGGRPWWRVVNASGRAPAHLTVAARERWADEGTALRPDGDRIDLARAIWFPPDGDDFPPDRDDA